MHLNDAASEHLGRERKQKGKEWYTEDWHNIHKRKVEARQRWTRGQRDEHGVECEKLRKGKSKKTNRKSNRTYMDNNLEVIEKQYKIIL